MKNIFWIVTMMALVFSTGCEEKPIAYVPIPALEKIEPTGDVLKDCADWTASGTIWNRGTGPLFVDCDYDGAWDLRAEAGRETYVVKTTDELVKRTTERLEDAASSNRVFRDLSGEVINTRIQRGGKTNGTRDLCVPIQDDPQKRELCGDDAFVARESEAWKDYQAEFQNLFGPPRLVSKNTLK
ncbi:MAG: hypothetical protein JNN11_05080 [Candidatus Doudnabacteria bacterium]|nr:hypothetical protein [Candidatus Doudnabacteria bacterium]